MFHTSYCRADLGKFRCLAYPIQLLPVQAMAAIAREGYLLSIHSSFIALLEADKVALPWDNSSESLCRKLCSSIALGLWCISYQNPCCNSDKDTLFCVLQHHATIGAEAYKRALSTVHASLWQVMQLTMPSMQQCRLCICFAEILRTKWPQPILFSLWQTCPHDA